MYSYVWLAIHKCTISHVYTVSAYTHIQYTYKYTNMSRTWTYMNICVLKPYINSSFVDLCSYTVLVFIVQFPTRDKSIP